MGEIQSSNLNYLTQETPYSLYITVRKKFTKDSQPYTCTPAQSSIAFEAAGIDTVGPKVKSLEAANIKLKGDLDQKCKENAKNMEASKMLQEKLVKTEAEIVKQYNKLKKRER